MEFDLPVDITSKILSRVPIKDALRTSILSKKWRYRWASTRALNFFETEFDWYVPVKYKIPNALYHVLLLHSGPLVELSLVFKQDKESEIDQIILHLSRNNTLEHIELVNSVRSIVDLLFNGSSGKYKLPSSFFSLQGLQYIDVSNCRVDPPLTFNGFSRLIKLIFDKVEITTHTLKHFLTNCPLLEFLHLIGDYGCVIRGNKLTFVELFECLPKIMGLVISRFYVEYFAAGGMPRKLPVPLVHLTHLVLDVCLTKQQEVSVTFFLINNSPNLQMLFLKSVIEPTTSVDVDLQDYSNVKLDHLKWLRISDFNNSPNEMEFVKLFMAKSMMLKTVRIILGAKNFVDEEVRMLRDLIQLPFPRASPSAKLLFQHRPKRC